MHVGGHVRGKWWFGFSRGFEVVADSVGLTVKRFGALMPEADASSLVEPSNFI